jgi:hypothetical protein
MRAGGQLVEHHPKREDVARRARTLAARLLRRHVAGSPEDHVLPRIAARVGAGRDGQEAGQAEVQQLDIAVSTQKHVLRLDVAMHDAGGVGRRQRLRELHAEVDDRRNRRAAARQRGERLPLDEFHRQEAATLELPYLVDGDDVRMVEGRGRAGLLLEPAGDVGASGERWAQELDRHLSSQPRILREVHLAHAPAAEQADDVVDADPAARERPRMFVLGDPTGSVGECRRPDEFTGLVVRCEERLHFPLQGHVAAAGPAQKRRTVRAGDLECCVVKPLDLTEVGARHSRFSSRNSQARAKLQSRRTVATEMPITSAASS